MKDQNMWRKKQKKRKTCDALIENQLAWPLAKVPEVALSFYSRGAKLIFTPWAVVSEIWADFSKLLYMSMKLGYWLKFQKMHIQSFSTPGGRNSAYFPSTGSGFQDTGRFSKLPYVGMKKVWDEVPMPVLASQATYRYTAPPLKHIMLLWSYSITSQLL